MKPKESPGFSEMKRRLIYDPTLGLFTWIADAATGRPRKGKVAGNINRYGYRRIVLCGKSYPAHRLAWLYMTGAWPQQQVDHRDGNRANDAWDNLREATHTENRRNARLQKNNTSGLKGITPKSGPRGKRWQSRIMVDRNCLHLGTFNCPAAAHFAYLIAASQHHGEFARAH